MNSQYNSKLQTWNNRIPNEYAGKGNIEKPGEYQNIIWQNRSYVPTEFQMLLSETLQQAYEKTNGTVLALITHLNDVGIYDENGQPWSVDSLTQYIMRVGI